MALIINETVLDMGLRPQALNLWLQMIYKSEDGVIVLSQKDFMELTNVKDPESNISYREELIKADLIKHIGLTNRKNTYELNNKYYYYK